MTEFTPWPADLADLYRRKGYWIGRPLCAGVEAQARERPEATAIICGDRRISYGALDRAACDLAARLARDGHGRGDRALVHLPNVAEDRKSVV